MSQSSDRLVLSPEGQQSLDDLRQERDRFVALAFCSADLLLELDPTGEVVFAAGATKVFTGRSATELQGVRIFDLIHPSDTGKLDRLLRDARAGTRIDGSHITLVSLTDEPSVLTISGFHMSDFGGHTCLSFRVRSTASVFADGKVVRVEGLEIHDKGSFAGAATRALKDSATGGDGHKLTMIELGAYDELRERLNDDALTELSAAMGSMFRSSSLGGDLAGQIDDNRFGLVHDINLDVTALADQIASYAREVDPTGEGVSVKSATVDVDSGAMSDKDTAKALVYTINRFCEETAEGFSVRNHSEIFSSLASETVDRLNKFIEMVRQGAFDIAFQPICDMRDGRPHHFEALVRFDRNNVETGPFEFITFAEEVGIICDFDLAMCRKVLVWLDKMQGQGFRYMTAVNLSGFSLSTPKFIDDLMALLSEFSEAREHILFEVTESAKLKDLEEANRII